MAVLGIGGRLYLKREAPDPCLVSNTAVDGANNVLNSICPGYWSGDHVVVSCLPVGTGNFPPNPEGYGSYYASKYFLGPNRSQITDYEDNFYKDATEEYPDGEFGDDSQFYSRVGDVSGGEEIQPCTDQGYWVHIDELGYASFYNSRCEALTGNKANRVPLYSNVAGSVGIAPFGSTDYNNALWKCFAAFGRYQFSDVQDTVTLATICDFAPTYQQPVPGTGDYDNANVLPRKLGGGDAAPYWQIICDMREWTLELSAPSVDTTAISEKFGEAVKSLVTGGGSADFLIDRKCYENTEDNGLVLMKLLLMTEKGCQASGKFYLIDRDVSGDAGCGQISGDLYYSADLLVTASAVNVRPTEILAGTANFVTTGEIKLLEAP